jgi:hypothetical protein
MADIGTLAPKIAQAKAAGYSDDEIVSFLSQQEPKFKQAKDAGYSGSEIISHLSNALPPIVVTEGGDTPKPDDHGLARRQQMSQVEKAVSPITEYPRNYQEMRQEAEHQVGRGVGQLTGALSKASGDLSQPGELGNLWEATKGAGNVALGSLGFVASPLSALYRSIVGQPLEDVTGIPREQTEFAAQLATPGIGFTQLAKAPGAAPLGPLIRPPAEVPRPVVAEAAQRLNEAGLPVDVPRAITGGRVAQETGQSVSKIPYAGEPIGTAIHTKLPQQLEEARNAVAAEHGAGSGANVANRVRTTLEEGAAAETQAATEAAAKADAEALAEWQRTNAGREATIADREAQSTQTAQQAVGPELHPQDMGDFVINRTRLAHDAAEARKNTLYENARDLDARISDSANVRLHGYVERSLEQAGIHTQEISGIRASRDMLRMLDRFSEAARGRAELAPVGQSMGEVEQLRKNLNLAYGTFENPTDKRVAKHIIDALDDWQVRATRDHLMPGSDPRAHPAMLEARAANRDLMQRFGYNQRDDADRLINKIVRGEEDQHTGSVGVSNALIHGGDKAAPLYRRVLEATGNDAEVAQSIRSGTWNKLTRDAEGNPLPPKTVQENVIKHLHGPGRDVAERVFDNSQRAFMRAHADTVVETAAQRKAAEAEAKATTPKPTKVEPGDIQKLADQVIGGKTSDEALFKTLHGYAKKGGDVKALARVMQQLPAEMRGDLAGSFVREIGIAPGTKQFSLDHFSNQWNTLTPQAKAIMFGNAGPHVTALNDIATIAKQLKDIKGRYGNPSGTGRQGTFAAIAALFTQSPKAALSSAAGLAAGHVAARVLAHPAGASSVRKYMRAVEQAERAASPAHMAAVKMTERNLANTVRALGAIHD